MLKGTINLKRESPLTGLLVDHSSPPAAAGP